MDLHAINALRDLKIIPNNNDEVKPLQLKSKYHPIFRFDSFRFCKFIDTDLLINGDKLNCMTVQKFVYECEKGTGFQQLEMWEELGTYIDLEKIGLCMTF